jgi:hypothetical protein
LGVGFEELTEIGTPISGRSPQGAMAPYAFPNGVPLGFTQEGAGLRRMPDRLIVTPDFI